MNKNKQKVKNQSGMTLIEIMIVVVIIGILGTIIIPKIIDRPDEARVEKTKQDIRAFEAALSLYKLDNFNYPTTDEGLQILLGRYMERIPADPWGNDYQFISPGSDKSYDIYSFGSDGESGGEGTAKDISN